MRPKCVDIFFCALLSLGLASCSHDIKISVSDLDNSMMAMYLQDGAELRLAWREPPPSCKDQFRTWFGKKKFSGRKSFVTYAPGILVWGRKFTLNFTNARIIYNAKKTGKTDWIQISCPYDDDSTRIRNCISNILSTSGRMMPLTAERRKPLQ